MYLLSVDLGTTFSAAAIMDGAEPRVVTLGSRTATIPSVVALRPDGTVLIGEAAERRAITDPTRVAREFKRRLGDPVSTIIGATPYSAEMLMAHLLRGIVDQVAEQQGERPGRIVLSHPANYGPYKLDLLEQVGHLAELEEVEFITEPQAAAIHYSEGERIEPGEVVAVYDLGGGTFDAALVLRTDHGFELLGTPDGLERFGGIDLDEAVFVHVRRSLGGAIDGVDPTDPAVVSALARLREDCRLAKEGLSSDTDAAIPVMLPSLHTEVRLVRSEFEDMIRPRLRETLATLERVVRSSDLGFKDLSRVLLVGGSSRIPLVAEMVREATGRPVALDAHPKHAIVLGAASAGLAGATRRTARAGTAPAVSPEVAPEPQLTVEVSPAAEPPARVPTEPIAGRAPVTSSEIEPFPVATQEGEDGGSREPRKPRRRLLIAGIAGVVAVAAAVTLAIVFMKGGETAPTTTASAAETTAASAAETTAASAAETTAASNGGTTVTHGTSETPGALPPVEGDAPAQNVLAIYMTAYVLPGDGGDWGLWNLAGTSAPPENIASDFYPAIGPYDVRDAPVIAQHFAWMRRAGIGTAAVAWAGADSPGNVVMPLVLEMADRYGLSFVLVVPFVEGAQQFLELAQQAGELYREQPSWLRMPGLGSDEPRPVVLLRMPGEMELDLDAWRPVLSGLDLTVVVESTDPVWIEAGADGLMFARIDHGYVWAEGLPEGSLYVPIVSPGFSEEWSGTAGAFADRGAGDLYLESWELAHAAGQPSLVVIDSFNAWSAGTQIEPAAEEYPERPSRPYSTYEPLPPEGYLEITREMVGQP
jgi:actin-like ATPase involved in cell morphogenesis